MCSYIDDLVRSVVVPCIVTLNGAWSIIVSSPGFETRSARTLLFRQLVLNLKVEAVIFHILIILVCIVKSIMIMGNECNIVLSQMYDKQ